MADGDNKNMIIGDEPTELSFVFETENRKFPITKEFIQLSGMLRDYIESIPESSDNQIPVKDFPAPSHEIVVKLLSNAKENDKEAYQKALKLENVDSEVPARMKEFFKDISPDDCINAANYCAYLSMDYAKRYFVNAYAVLTKETASADIRKLSAAFGATPLGSNDIEDYELQGERQIWIAYPDVYKDAYGHAFEG